ncbi:response regulator [Bdellovibrio sp. HCB209]|uniref:response regulator n=1 Tax=Bdellovibrio sp. HCB209 TaxID=3394354 RepID=UPI0039B48040
MSLKQPLQLLHVDDSAILRKTIGRGLEAFKEHYELTQAGSVDEALALLSSGKKFDLILTDWLMAGKSGIDLLCMLKCDPSYHHLPVFFLTSEYESSSLITAVTHGASGILKKPTTGPEIHAYLQKKSAVIEESQSFKEEYFCKEAIELLGQIHMLLPFKDAEDLSACAQYIHKFKEIAGSSKWPLLADYCQRIEDVIQLTIKNEVEMLSPLTGLVMEYHSFMRDQVSELVSHLPHQLLTEEIEKNLKNYRTSLDAGWFGHKDHAAGGHVVLPLNVVTDLQKHLSPEGLEILKSYLNAKKQAS